MGTSSVTILELHLGDGDVEIGPFELFGASDSSAAVDESELTAETDAEPDADEGETESGGVSAKSIAGLLLALVALLAVAVGVAKLRGDDEEVPPGIAGDQ